MPNERQQVICRLRDSESFADYGAESAIWADWSAPPTRQLAVLLALVALGIAALPFDLAFSRSLVEGESLRFLHGLLESFEPFGQPTAIVVTAAAVALCDARRRVAMPRLLAAALGSGLAANLVKLCIARYRPNHYDLAGSVFSGFEGLFPGPWIGSRLQSCPSAHTATAAGFCLALWSLFPAARGLFVALAGLVALQRIEAGAHHLSDTIWGAAVAYAVCMTLFRPSGAGAWFDRKESARWKHLGSDQAPVAKRLTVVGAADESEAPECGQ